MLFDEDFLAQITEKPIDGILEICRIVSGYISDNQEGWEQGDYEVLLEALALIDSLDEIGLISTPYSIPSISGAINEDCSSIYQYLITLEDVYKAEASKLKLQNLKAHFKTNLEGGFCYEFSQGDLDRIQILINELRDHVTKSDHFEQDHKQRLLKRLENLQSEIHKKVSDLDKFWGLIGDAGVAIGKFGNDAKPIVDRIREIKDIVWRTQARAEELPSGSPLPKLEDKSDNA